MKDRIRRHAWALGYTLVLSLFTLYVLLDTFVIPRAYGTVASINTDIAAAATVTATTYTDEDITLTISTVRAHDTDIYVADIQVSDPTALKTALAHQTFGRNITAATSEIAAENNAILAINGDFYGSRSTGYVIRNGELLRQAAAAEDQEDLVIWADGRFELVTEGAITAPELAAQGAWQVFSFGPGLLDGGVVTVSPNDEVDKAMASNPRTALGMIDTGHYVYVVADGRSDTSTGLTLYQLAGFLQTLDVETAYNLDGGGSSTMVFNGTVINNPTSGHGRVKERSVSDIVYLGH